MELINIIEKIIVFRGITIMEIIIYKKMLNSIMKGETNEVL